MDGNTWCGSAAPPTVITNVIAQAIDVRAPANPCGGSGAIGKISAGIQGISTTN